MRALLWSLTSSLVFSLACSAAGPRKGLDGNSSGSSGDGSNSSGDGSGNGSGTGNGTNSPGTGNGTNGSSSGSNGTNGSTSGTNSGAGGDSAGAFFNDDDPLLQQQNLPAPEGCGNGTLTDDEACDDGNLESGDGCSANCLQLEPGFSCAEPGKACIVIARCGDGFVAPSEQCDDGNMTDGDGCSARCRVELGSKCDGAPSTCTPTTCGDGVKEGAEACDDGNTVPFDGCSSLCLREPNCEGLSCTSDCGDGLVINEECDDGNQISGDGCSADCKIEGGFTCERATACERINDECILRVPAIFRDFDDDRVDFGDHSCSTLAQGAVEQQLSADGKPVMREGVTLPEDPCLSTAANFAQWYSDSDADAILVDELVLFDNGRGGYVNRFDKEGDFFTSTADGKSYPGGATMQACEASCRDYVSNQDFMSGCNNYCQPAIQNAQQAPQRLADAERQLQDAIQQYGAGAGDAGVPPQVAAAQAKVDTAQAAADAADAEAATCQTDCMDGIDAGTMECAATCLPCSSGYCTGGHIVEWEGSPLFFPVDSLIANQLGTCKADNPTDPAGSGSPGCAKVPSQYGYDGWPWEGQLFPGAKQHNFYFTSEVQYWFQYDANMNATLDFTGDDDVWVFINGKLAVDIGGIHIPVNGSVTINAAMGTLNTTVMELPTLVTDPNAPFTPESTSTDRFTAADFGLEEGNVYKITIFHAERQKEGSSFKLTLSGFEATPSDCSAICGDGILSFGEECDDGVNDGGYGECAEGCKLGPFCGDGEVQGDEDCDNGPGGGDGCPNCRILKIK